MKRISVYLLIFLLSFVYSSESIQMLAKALGNKVAFAWMANIENSESNTESEESKEQKEKIEFLGHYINTQLTLALQGSASLNSSHCINFSSSDYSQTIYSPPEDLA